MKKRIGIITITILAALALVAAPVLFAGPHGARMRMHGMRGEGFGGGILGHLQRAKEELNLSDEQIDQIKAIFREAHEQNAASRESLRANFHDAALALLANPNDLAGAQALLERQTAAEKQMKLNLLTATSKALNVLNADQRSKLSEMVNERYERRGQRSRTE